MKKNQNHKYIRGDRVEVPEQMFLGNRITRGGIGVVRQIRQQKFGNATQELLIIQVDGQGNRKYLSNRVRWIGGPENE
jgi:hypothetical protein